MQNRSIQINPIHARAISNGVAEALRLSLPKEEPQPGSSLQKLISRLPQLDDPPPIAARLGSVWRSLSVRRDSHESTARAPYCFSPEFHCVPTRFILVF